MALPSEDTIRKELLDSLNKRLDALRQKGVIVPKSYPPANLDPAQGPFKGFLGEVRLVERLCEIFPPRIIEMLEPPEKPTGNDIDVIVHTVPPHYFQVKDFLITSVNIGGQVQSVEGLINSARKVALDDIAKRWSFVSTYSYLRIILDGSGQPTFSDDSETRVILHSRIVHVIVVELDCDVLKETTERRLERGVKVALKQLPKESDGVVVPVLNLIGFPHDQALAYTKVKEILNAHQWKIGGVLLLTNEYSSEQNQGSLIEKKERLIAIANPNAEDGHRLEEKAFNPEDGDSDVYSEPLVFITVTPPDATPYIEGDILMIESTPFGKLGSGLSVVAIRYY